MFRFAYRVQELAANQPAAGQDYALSGTPTLGYRAFSSVYVDGDQAVVLAEEPGGAAWEICEAVYLANNLHSRTLVDSSSGALIDWAALGVEPQLSVIDRAEGMGREIARWSHAVDGDTALIDFEWAFVVGRTYALMLHGLRHNGAGSESMLMRMKRAGSWDSGASDYGIEATQRRNTALTTRAETREWIRVTTQTIFGSAAGVSSFGNQVRVGGSAWFTSLGALDYSHVSIALNSPTDVAPSYGNDSVQGVHRYRNVVEGVRLFWTTSQFDGGTVQLLEF